MRKFAACWCFQDSRRHQQNSFVTETGKKARRDSRFLQAIHAQAVALASRETGIRSVVAIPADAPKAKIEATRNYGADIRFFDFVIRMIATPSAAEIAEREGWCWCPPTTDY